MSKSEHNEIIVDDFLNGNRFTKQTRRELKEWIPEIAYRENISVDDVINGDVVQKILRDEKLNNPQKYKKIRDALYRMRFPEFSRLRDCWKKAAAAANPVPSKIQFIPSPAFEKKRMEIKLTAKDTAETLELLKSLSKIKQEVWDILLLPS